MNLFEYYELPVLKIDSNFSTAPDKEYTIISSTTLLLDGATTIGLKSVVIENMCIRNNHTTEALKFQILKDDLVVYDGEVPALDGFSLLTSTDDQMLTRMIRDAVGNYSILTSSNITWKIRITSESEPHSGVLEVTISYR